MFRTICMLLAITLTAGFVLTGTIKPLAAAEQTDNGGFGVGSMQSDSYAAFNDPQPDSLIDPSTIEPAAGDGTYTGTTVESPAIEDTPENGLIGDAEKALGLKKPID